MPNFPVLPTRRMFYDRDGTVAYWKAYSTSGPGWFGKQTGADLVLLNKEDGAGINYSMGATVWFVFPQRRDLTGVFFSTTYSGSTILTSTDTTGTTTDAVGTLDGTWTPRSTPPLASPNSRLTIPYMRSFILPLAVTGVSGVAVLMSTMGANLYNVHMYGSVSSGESLDRLDAWHQTTDAVVTGDHLNFNDIPRGSTQTKSFRVKNRSTTKTASGVQVTLDIPSNPSPTLVGQIQASLDGTTWANGVSLPNLAPGAVSAVVQVRYNPSLSASLGVFAPRLLITASGWS